MLTNCKCLPIRIFIYYYPIRATTRFSTCHDRSPIKTLRLKRNERDPSVSRMSSHHLVSLALTSPSPPTSRLSFGDSLAFFYTTNVT